MKASATPSATACNARQKADGYTANDLPLKNWIAMSDKAPVGQIGKYVRHYRLEQNKTQDTLAEKAGISHSTLSLPKRGESVTLGTLIQVLRVLDQIAKTLIYLK